MIFNWPNRGMRAQHDIIINGKKATQFNLGAQAQNRVGHTEPNRVHCDRTGQDQIREQARATATSSILKWLCNF